MYEDSSRTIEVPLIVTKQIVSYIYMLYNIIENFVELFPYFVSCILRSTLFFLLSKFFMPPMDEYPGSATANHPPF